jgi:hypothetical protein
MSVANPLWGAPRIHGELLKLGIDVGQTTVAKYMARRTQFAPFLEKSGWRDWRTDFCWRRAWRQLWCVGVEHFG